MGEIHKSNKEELIATLECCFSGDKVISKKKIIETTGSYNIDKQLAGDYGSKFYEPTITVFLEEIDEYLRDGFQNADSYVQLVRQMLEQTKIFGFKSIQYFVGIQHINYLEKGISINPYNPLSIISVATMQAYKYINGDNNLSCLSPISWSNLSNKERHAIKARTLIYRSGIFAPENLDNIKFEDLNLDLLGKAFPEIDNLEGLLRESLTSKETIEEH